MEWSDDGIIVGGRPHGETSSVISVLTRERGRHPGLLRGARQPRMRAAAAIGNRVHAHWRARLEENLGVYTLEIVESPAPALITDGDRLQAMAAAAAVVDTALPEREPAPGALDDLAVLIHHLAGGLDWREAYVRWEVSLLAALGYGLELGRCAVTGAVDGLIWVSPRTGRGVSAVAGEPYRDRLLPLPAFLLESGASAGKGDIAAGLTLTAHFLEKHVYGPERRPLPPARQAFAMRMDRSGRMAGG